MAPTTFAEYIDAIRAELVCDRCRRYVGSLAARRYLPPPYPVAVGGVGPDDEAQALVNFEWHMVGLLRAGKFVIRHPERDGQCITYREWVAVGAGEGEAEDAEEAGSG
jgi:hypothetical protein